MALSFVRTSCPVWITLSSEVVSEIMRRDEAKHGGHIIKREQAHLNRELNHNSRAIYNQRHKN
jgi:hypothetical protein